MVQSFDEVEDLTRFADESFDTDTVDLFEFTGNEDSPLTRLKSIILSLDWEITDEILDELIEEVANLRTLWEGDKVAQVYLQGLDKVGKYLKAEGAYAHHNSIKLLLTLFYNYEKIISSPDISGDEITSLLKSDIRKFKVLQYQIGMKGASTVGSQTSLIDTGVRLDETATDENHLAAMEAAILSLDWEVTDEALQQFNNQAALLNEHLSDNAHARVLVQGLQAIGSYISDEKAHSHPDAFNLLHSFYDGLKTLVTESGLDSDKRQEVVIDRVSRLNSLKEIIAGTAAVEPVVEAEDKVDHILDLNKEGSAEESFSEEIDFADESSDQIDELDIALDSDEAEDEQPAGAVEEPQGEIEAEASLIDEDEFDIDMDIEETVNHVNAAMETADEHYPDEILDPSAIQPLSNEIADEFIAEELSLSSSWQPDSDDSDTAGLALEPDAAPMSEDELDDELEILFDDGEDIVAQKTTEDNAFEELALGIDDEEIVNDKSDSNALNFEESIAAEDQQGENDDLDFDDELFLSEDEDERVREEDNELIPPALADSDEEGEFLKEAAASEIDEEPSIELEEKLDSFFDFSDDEQPEAARGAEAAQDLADDEFLSPALSDTAEDQGFNEDTESTGLAEEASVELEEKLDSFFDLDEEPDTTADEMSVDAGEGEEIVAALADESLEGGFREEEAIAELNENPSDDLQDKLDSFFGSDDEAESGTVAEDSSLPLEEDVDSFFTEETTPALAGAAETSGFDEDDEISGLADSAMDEIDDKLDSFFDLEEEESSDDAAVSLTALSSLASVAAALSGKPDKTELKQVSELVAALKEENKKTNQTVLLTMIDSVVDLLGKHPAPAAGDTTIVQELVGGLENADNPAALIDMVRRYTSWQNDVFDQIVSSQQKVDTEAQTVAADVPYPEIIAQVESGFSQLRDTLQEEFASIKKELKNK